MNSEMSTAFSNAVTPIGLDKHLFGPPKHISVCSAPRRTTLGYNLKKRKKNAEPSALHL